MRTPNLEQLIQQTEQSCLQVRIAPLLDGLDLIYEYLINLTSNTVPMSVLSVIRDWALRLRGVDISLAIDAVIVELVRGTAAEFLRAIDEQSEETFLYSYLSVCKVDTQILLSTVGYCKLQGTIKTLTSQS